MARSVAGGVSLVRKRMLPSAKATLAPFLWALEMPEPVAVCAPEVAAEDEPVAAEAGDEPTP